MLDLIVLYELLIYLVVPVSTFIDLLPLLAVTTSRLGVYWRSLFRDTYLITPLSEQTLVLAESIRKKRETPKIQASVSTRRLEEEHVIVSP